MTWPIYRITHNPVLLANAKISVVLLNCIVIDWDLTIVQKSPEIFLLVFKGISHAVVSLSLLHYLFYIYAYPIEIGIYQRLDRFIIASAAVHPASGNLKIFTFPFKRMIYLIAISHTNSFEILKKLSWMVCLSGLLIIIKYDLPVRLILSRPIYPHVTFAARRSAIFVYQQWCFVCLYHMAFIQISVKIVVNY